MNILILNDFGRVTGGAAAVAIASARGLAARGHRVIFLSAVGKDESGLQAAGVEVLSTGQHGIRDRKRIQPALQRTWNTVAADALRLRLASLNARDTIVHLHGWTKALSPSVARAALGRRFKLVCTLHDYSAACPRGSFFNDRKMDHCRLKPLSLPCIGCNCDSRGYLHKLGRTFKQVTQMTLGRIPSGVDALIVVSRFSRKIFGQSLPSRVPIFEVPNPIEVAQEKAVDVAGNRSLVMVGRMTVDKGALLAARATAEWAAPVVFVGNGPCESEVVSLNRSAIVTGWLAKESVQSHLRQARALLFPSLQYETQGLAVPEAAALGVPAVVSDTCAASDSVRDGVTGLHFANGNVESLMAALRRLNDDALVRRLGAAAYEAHWAAAPTLERHVQRLENVYQSILTA